MPTRTGRCRSAGIRANVADQCRVDRRAKYLHKCATARGLACETLPRSKPIVSRTASLLRGNLIGFRGSGPKDVGYIVRGPDKPILHGADSHNSAGTARIESVFESE